MQRNYNSQSHGSVSVPRSFQIWNYYPPADDNSPRNKIWDSRLANEAVAEQFEGMAGVSYELGMLMSELDGKYRLYQEYKLELLDKIEHLNGKSDAIADRIQTLQEAIANAKEAVLCMEEVPIDKIAKNCFEELVGLANEQRDSIKKIIDANVHGGNPLTEKSETQSSRTSCKNFTVEKLKHEIKCLELENYNTLEERNHLEDIVKTIFAHFESITKIAEDQSKDENICHRIEDIRNIALAIDTMISIYDTDG
jgi:predicted nuclease with TOPRIM domain